MMMKRARIRGLCSSMVLGLLFLMIVPSVAAHPLGNFSVNRYSRIEVGPDAVTLRYVLDLAEIPTLQELRAQGVKGRAFDDATGRRLLAEKTEQLASNARLSVDGMPITWTVTSAAFDLLPGQADLDTTRVELTLSAARFFGAGARLDYRDANYAGRVGWHEVVMRGVGGLAVSGSAPAQDVTDELRAYPDNPSRAPLDVSSASATLSWAAEVTAEAQAGQRATSRSARRFAVDPTTDYLAGFITGASEAGPWTLAVALAVAVGLGALHALEPGHGKTLVGSYLVGSRGTPGQAVLLGLTVTATHTVGVYALGLTTLVAAQYVVPEVLYPILGVISGLMVVVVGISLVRVRLSPLLARFVEERWVDVHDGDSDHHEHDHAHVHGHVHEDAHVHGHAPVHGHDHLHHAHGHDPHSHRASPTVAEAAVPHSHGGVAHIHRLPGEEGRPVSLRSLLTLGVSGGLLPCPSALVVLLSAISLHNVGFGLVLVGAFSVGLAGVLTGLGLALVSGGRLLGHSRIGSRVAESGVKRAIPALSALAVTIAGVAMTAQAARMLG